MPYIGNNPTDVPLTSAQIADGTIVQADMDMTSNFDFTGTVTGAGASNRNDIINGGLVVNQENQTAPADDAYTIGDLFLHVGEGTPVMSLETDGPQGTRPWQKMVLDSNAQGGLVYFLSNADVQDYIANGKLSFGVQLKTTAATIANARIGILKWNSTADAVTSDVVGTWASDGTDPTLATNWTYENTPANLALTTSWQRFTVENITVDSDTTNIAVFIWTDDGTITASDVIGFSEWQCNPGATVNDFSQPNESLTRWLVDYYFQEYNYAESSSSDPVAHGHFSTTSNLSCTFSYRRNLRVAPTFSHSGITTFDVLGAFGNQNPATSILLSELGTEAGRLACLTTGTPFTTGQGGYLGRDGTDTAWMRLDSRF